MDEIKVLATNCGVNDTSFDTVLMKIISQDKQTDRDFTCKVVYCMFSGIEMVKLSNFQFKI